MPTFYFMGYMEPRETDFNAENISRIVEQETETGIMAKYTLAILDSVISVECEVEQYDPKDIDKYFTRAYELAKSLINLVSVKHGWGFSIHIDTFIDPDGKEGKMANQASFLSGILDAYTIDQLDDVYVKIACDIDLSAAFNDLNDCLDKPRVTQVNCGRVLDFIKNRIAPNMKEKAAWAVVQNSLNADESYLQYISNASTTPRHGRHTFPSASEIEEVLTRTWTIFNRFLHLHLGSLEQLPTDQFPRLKTFPTPQS
jgi:hypothetical protein